MQITPKENIESFSLPLPIYQTIHIADAVSNDGIRFKIIVGLDKELIEQLKKYSADESDIDLQKYTKDKERFIVGTYEDWYKKNRTLFALVEESSGIMAAQIRFGPEPLLGDVGNWHTAGWRSYSSFRGKGIMKDFSKFALDVYLEHFPNINIWITAKRENAGSVRLAEALGFKTSDEKSNETSLVMIR